jgi:sec-independent protein translocase protein TatB
MFSDFGSMELMLIVLVTLLVIGPERLPEVLRTLGLWFGRLSRSFTAIKVEVEQEIGMDDVRRQLHNESVMAEMQKIENEVKHSIQPPTPNSTDQASQTDQTENAAASESQPQSESTAATKES